MSGPARFLFVDAFRIFMSCIMAKNQTNDEAEKKPTTTGTAEPTEVKTEAKPEAKKPKAPKAPAPSTEKVEGAPPQAEASKVTAAARAAEAAAPKKKRKPGVPPARGKKLRNHLKNLEQKLSKEGLPPLKKAITLLKQAKRSKFDETV